MIFTPRFETLSLQGPWYHRHNSLPVFLSGARSIDDFEFFFVRSAGLMRPLIRLRKNIFGFVFAFSKIAFSAKHFRSC